MTEILYVVEHHEGGKLWLANFAFSAPTRTEAEDERDEFMGLYPYHKPREVRIGKYECKRIGPKRRKRSRK